MRAASDARPSAVAAPGAPSRPPTGQQAAGAPDDGVAGAGLTLCQDRVRHLRFPGVALHVVRRAGPCTRPSARSRDPGRAGTHGRQTNQGSWLGQDVSAKALLQHCQHQPIPN